MKTLSLALILAVTSVSCQPADDQSTYVKQVIKDRKDKNKKWLKEGSPLLEEDRKNFSSLVYYSADDSWNIPASFVKNEAPDTVIMATSTEREVRMLNYGTYHFSIDNTDYQLIGYQNLDYPEPTLFVPFNDLTNGEETYGGGRYMDLEVPQGDSSTVDFNRAYNPYCAYNYNYSCPIPPKENKLEVAIKAGEKKFH